MLYRAHRDEAWSRSVNARELDERSASAPRSLPARLIPLLFALITALFGLSEAFVASLAEAEAQRGDETETTLELTSREFDHAAADAGPPVPVVEIFQPRLVGLLVIDLPFAPSKQPSPKDEQRDTSRFDLGSRSVRGPPLAG